MNKARIWQEYDCPDSLIDFDLTGDELLFIGQETNCSACGNTHRAGADQVIDQTSIDAGQGVMYFGIPKDRDELALWIGQAASSRPRA